MLIENSLVSLDKLVGNKVEGNSVNDVMDAGGFNFEVVEENLGNDVPGADNWKVLRRGHGGDVINVVRDSYQVIQNREILEPFDEVRREFKADWAQCGVIGNGNNIWVSAKLPEEHQLKSNNEDKLCGYIMAILNHDGTRADAVFPYVDRLFCNNQFNTVAKSARGMSIMHRSNYEQRIQVLMNGFKKGIENNIEFIQTADNLDSQKISREELEKVVNRLFPDKKVRNKGEEVLLSGETSRNRVMELFSTGAGNKGETRWDAFNAVTEYVDHHQGAKRINNAIERDGQSVLTSDRMRRGFERRFMNNMIGGQNNSLKHSALKLLSGKL